jgi:hypothetical protein
MVRLLVEAGADQTTRSNVRANIVHSILEDHYTLRKTELDRIQELLGLIDTRLISSLFTERTTQSPGAATPLARWLHTNVKSNVYRSHPSDEDWKIREKFVKLILEFTKGEDLNIVNGEGDTPIHAVVRYGADTLLRIMLECRPELLFRENASGRTPYEMAEDAYLAKEVFSDPPPLSASDTRHSNRGHRHRYQTRSRHQGLLTQSPRNFVQKPKDERSRVEKVWLVCKEFADKCQGRKRKLVSLVEANEVAKRLAMTKGSGVRRGNEDEEEVDKDEEDIKGDEVAVWFSMGRAADSK